MCIRHFQIKFDNTGGTYHPGQNVTGRVLVGIDSVERIGGVELELRGAAAVHWTKTEQVTNGDERSNRKTIHFKASEVYFENHFNLIGETVLPPGDHVYTFSMSLPTNIPSSFEGKYGQIRYTGKAKIIQPRKKDHKTNTPFIVAAHLDLNCIERAKRQVQQASQKYFQFCCCQLGPLEMVVSIPVRGYVPGQDMPITIELDNASNVNVNEVKCNFRQIVNYNATSPQRDSRKDKYHVQTILFSGVSEGSSTRATKLLRIPALPPTDLKNCSIIKLSYDLQVIAKGDGWDQDLLIYIPITIGSVPLSSFQNPTVPLVQSAGTGWGTTVAHSPTVTTPLLRAPQPYPSAPLPNPAPHPPPVHVIYSTAPTSNPAYSRQPNADDCTIL